MSPALAEKAAMDTLRTQMQADMILRGLAPRTQQHYNAAVAGLAGHYHKSPDAMSQDEVQHNLLHPVEERKLAWSSTNQIACALRFFYHVMLARRDTSFIIPNRRVPARLPEILSREEVLRMLDAFTNLRRWTLFTTTYAAGLRVTETCSLKVVDIESERLMLRVCGGKGGKNRYTLFSPALHEIPERLSPIAFERRHFERLTSILVKRCRFTRFVAGG